MVALLTDDAWLTMPPVPLQYQGPAAIAEFMWLVGFRSGTRHYRLVPTAANGQPAYGCYIRDDSHDGWRPHGLLALAFERDRVSAVTRFVDNDLMAWFELPAVP
jgi:RNA polymerase sigma-70 factor (ECF subfamily)